MTKGTVATRTSQERAFLVAVASRSTTETVSAEDSLEELAQLASTAGAEVVGRLVQSLPTPSRTNSDWS